MSETDTTPARARRFSTGRLALAALAVLGIGGAITTAAWTEQALFSADAEAATFTLEASLDGSEWGVHPSGNELTIPIDASGFGDLVPSDQARTLTVLVRNTGSVPMDITARAATSGALFAAGSPVSVGVDPGAETLAPGDADGTPLTIALTPGDMPPGLKGASGTITLTVTGQVAPTTAP